MHTKLINPFKWHQSEWPWNIDSDLYTENIKFGFCCHQGHSSFTNVCFILEWIRMVIIMFVFEWFVCIIQSVGTVNFALPFTTNLTISISILQTFRSWVATSHLRPPMAIHVKSPDLGGRLPLFDLISLLRSSHAPEPPNDPTFFKPPAFPPLS